LGLVVSSDRFEKPLPRISSSIVPAASPGGRFAVANEIGVLWSDLDALGHVNNARYFTWFEETRLAYFRTVGFDLTADALVKPVLASTSIDYLRSVCWPDTVRVEGKVSRLGRTSLTMDYRVTSVGQGTVVATGSAVIVLLAPNTNRPAQIPDTYRDAIKKLDPDARETL
jgi:acyl-CoA thioester hydrolase